LAARGAAIAALPAERRTPLTAAFAVISAFSGSRRRIAAIFAAISEVLPIFRADFKI